MALGADSGIFRSHSPVESCINNLLRKSVLQLATDTGNGYNTGTINEGDSDNKPTQKQNFGCYHRLEGWVARDDIRIDDPDIVRGLLRSLLFVIQVRDTPVVQTKSYDEIEKALIDTVVSELFADESMSSGI